MRNTQHHGLVEEGPLSSKKEIPEWGDLLPLSPLDTWLYLDMMLGTTEVALGPLKGDSHSEPIGTERGHDPRSLEVSSRLGTHCPSSGFPCLGDIMCDYF